MVVAAVVVSSLPPSSLPPGTRERERKRADFRQPPGFNTGAGPSASLPVQSVYTAPPAHAPARA